MITQRKAQVLRSPVFSGVAAKERDDVHSVPKNKNLEAFEKEINSYNYIRLVLADLNGCHLSKLISTRYTAKIIKNKFITHLGVMSAGMNGEALLFPENQKFNLGYGYLVPDYATLLPLPWLSEEISLPAKITGRPSNKPAPPVKFVEVICDQIWPNAGPVEASPRFIARQQLEYLRNEKGLKLCSFFGAEFRVFKQAPYKYELVEQGIGFSQTTALNRFQATLIRADIQLQQAGIDIIKFNKATGSSQLEASLAPGVGVQPADLFFQFRQAIKEIFQLEGYQVSFMTKPHPHEPANSTFFTHSLIDNNTGEMIMYEENAENKLSKRARHWIGGLVKHARALTALTAPTVNCYRRFRDPGFTPTHTDWAIDNRLRSICVENDGPNGTFVELRTVTSAACPYIVMAATVAAGLDGLRNEIEPPEDVTENRDRPVSGEEAARFQRLPASLSEALDCLEADEVIKNALGYNFIDWFIRNRRETCLIKLDSVNIEKENEEDYKLERERYFDYF